METISSSAVLSSAKPILRRPPETSTLAASLHIPPTIGRLVPRSMRNVLRALRIRILMHGFRKPREIKQSTEESLASAFMSIVVPVHDAPAVTRRCLSSLEQYAPKAEIVLVDDGSRLVETVDLIREFVDRNGWQLVRHETPFGHSVASEVGARLTTRPYLCLLNSDTVVTPCCWRLTKRAFEKDNNIAVVGPSTSRSSNIQTLPVASYLRQHWNDNQICDFAMRLLAEPIEPIVVDLAWVSGFALFVRRDVWAELGGFDQNLPDYGNEVDLCRRIEARGYRRVWVRNAYIHHLGGQSYGEAIGDEAIDNRKSSSTIYIQGKVYDSTN
jgi:GT2 family glycosyltransferase